MIQKIKTALYTLMFVFIVTLLVLYTILNNSIAKEQEQISNEVANTLEVITRLGKTRL